MCPEITWENIRHCSLAAIFNHHLRGQPHFRLKAPSKPSFPSLISLANYHLLVEYFITKLTFKIMSTSTHYIRTIHTSFTGLPSSAINSPSSSSGGILSSKYPPGLGFPGWRASPASSFSYRNDIPASTSKKRPAIRFPLSSRRAPPPPPYASRSRASRDSYSSDQNMVIYDSEPVARRPRSVSISVPPPFDPTATIMAPPPLQQQRSRVAPATPYQDRDSRSKLVAGILLHRVHAVGKPMRRRPGEGQAPREYVRSGLSRMVTVEA